MRQVTTSTLPRRFWRVKARENQKNAAEQLRIFKPAILRRFRAAVHTESRSQHLTAIARFIFSVVCGPWSGAWRCDRAFAQQGSLPSANRSILQDNVVGQKSTIGAGAAMTAAASV